MNDIVYDIVYLIGARQNNVDQNAKASSSSSASVPTFMWGRCVV